MALDRPSNQFGDCDTCTLGGLGLARSSVNLALDAVPENVDREQVEAYLHSLPGVTVVHDLHIWAMSTTETALTVHLVRPNAGLDDGFIAAACERLDRDFKIHHATIQIERCPEACRLCAGSRRLSVKPQGLLG